MTSKVFFLAGPKYPFRSKFGLDKTLLVNTFFLLSLGDMYEFKHYYDEGIAWMFGLKMVSIC